MGDAEQTLAVVVGGRYGGYQSRGGADFCGKGKYILAQAIPKFPSAWLLQKIQVAKFPADSRTVVPAQV